jgi:hypothetical protein
MAVYAIVRHKVEHAVEDRQGLGIRAVGAWANVGHESGGGAVIPPQLTAVYAIVRPAVEAAVEDGQITD